MASATPVALLTNGTVRLARGFASITYTLPSLTAYWTLMRPTTCERLGERTRVLVDLLQHRTRERRRRDRARRVAGVHAGLLDVLHHGRDDHLAGAIAQRVDIDLDRVFEEAVDQRGALRRQPALAARVNR